MFHPGIGWRDCGIPRKNLLYSIISFTLDYSWVLPRMQVIFYDN